MAATGPGTWFPREKKCFDSHLLFSLKMLLDMEITFENFACNFQMPASKSESQNQKTRGRCLWRQHDGECPTATAGVFTLYFPNGVEFDEFTPKHGSLSLTLIFRGENKPEFHFSTFRFPRVP